ncbi:flagellar biosynthesis protein FlhA [Anaerotignum propionicum]|uniref:Flagellar biosynthesis protein FlhA n=1 Tax=Anaerotignum propionicum DSM 1682 TaxID=991789 RepID=A0A120MKI7_ANAPI|nr:flagellar biosynthesis protein FlhA [Anaerotignum propionicum]AMJ42381.1 flagellar biosynthesis protein FlhA [Anaerotignum propionicum DSM 1682]MEA5058214.1 flagellar biosynthesis protein FlhA [Anaerotignum propionicum]SHF00837.1 flagellar biosynthesis protein FlhA [[Clostridium] propionicum DSM 1682] [Anaerotignum propionicum DSM 1682]
MKKLLQNSVSLFVILIVLLLLIPLRPFLLDTLFIINISVSLIILLITMNIKESLEFSIFPSLLLITTLFRLGLNISSTRLILTEQGEAGKVIAAFGKFVLQGNVVVGTIIFIIIVLVQFIVISKGAERVAEVAARFTLDAMPGKQMAIDADLNSGLITEAEAKVRRYKIQKEADFYGAMDGATKIVKGDAVMSIIITVINFCAGVIIGLVQSGMSFSEVLKVYSIATIGDGLVSQIPALLISTATGMIVTRAVSDGSLNTDVATQFLAQPQAMLMGGSIVGLISVIPGMPTIALLLTSAMLLSLGYFSRRNMKLAIAQDAGMQEAEFPQQMASEEDYFKDVNNIYPLLNVEPIEMEFGYSLIPLVDDSGGGKLINRIVIFRRQYAQDMGFVIPSIRLRDSASLNPNEYSIKIKGEEIASGEILVDYYLAIEPSDLAGEIDGIDTIEPAYGIPSKWILPENKELAEIYGYTVIDPLSVMLTHMSEVVSKHSYELLSRAEVLQLIENVKASIPELVEEAFPNIISYSSFQKILSNLLKEGVPIKDLVTVIETIVDSSSTTKDLDMITENIRVALKRTITRKFCEGGQMKVITLDAELEKIIVSSMAKSEHGIYLSLSPDILQKVLLQVSENVKKFNDISVKPVILTSHVVRVYFYRLIEQFYPNVSVISFNEIANNVQIQSIGNIVL